MQPIPYLFFKGDCAEAMRLYGRVFGAEPEILSAEAAPEDVRRQMGDAASGVMHAAVRVGDGWLFASDDMSANPPPPMEGSSIALAFPDDAETRRVWDGLAEGGSVRMPLEPTFFSPLFGTLTDRFGTRWMLMTEMKES